MYYRAVASPSTAGVASGSDADGHHQRMMMMEEPGESSTVERVETVCVGCGRVRILGRDNDDGVPMHRQASQLERIFFRRASTNDALSAPRVQFNGITAPSERSSRVSRSEMGRSVAHVYEPTLQERAQRFLEGPSGLYLELINLAFSVLMFGLYILELYNRELVESSPKRIFEMILTSFFIFDMGLHLFVAQHPMKYVFSIYGAIDLITIIPSFLMYFVTKTTSQPFFILRVLRIFRALRVLRLKRFIKFKRHGFNYELSVFLLSAVAVILCAAGMYHAMEEEFYLNHGESFYFHDSLYFILVTMSTVGYGDIYPKTILGQMFVLLLIIAVFTVLPQKIATLNVLSKQNHAYDKDYVKKGKRPGHVIVSGYDLTTESVMDFLNEFYHTSRGTIYLDVVFMCETPPSHQIVRLLATDRYAHRTCYLRGSLSNGNDQRRAQLGEATAVFFLSNKLFRRDSSQQDARTLLQTLAVRNFADSWNIHVDVYLQFRSCDQELELSSQLLGCNTANTSELRAMLLSRAAMCPGSSTLILNLLRSVSSADYSGPVRAAGKAWTEEYVDGMSYQIFPVIFTKRFQFEKFEDVVRNIYERYSALLVMVRPRRSRKISSSSTELRIAPFSSFIKEGDIGIVLAKSAASVLHIANTYGYWNDNTVNSSLASPLHAPPVRVSSESLMKRPSPRSRLQLSQSSGSLFSVEQSRSGKTSDVEAEDKTVRDGLSLGPTSLGPSLSGRSCQSKITTLDKIDEATSTLQSPCISPIVVAHRRKELHTITEILKQSHFVDDACHLEGHFVVCAGRLSDSLSIVGHIKRFCEIEARFQPTSRAFSQLGSVPRFCDSPPFVLLVTQLPSGSDISSVLRQKEDGGEDINNLLQNVHFVVGDPSKISDLSLLAIQRARRVIILPSSSSSFTLKLKPNAVESQLRGVDGHSLQQESLADFGVINSLLVAEVVREELLTCTGGKPSPKRRLSSRQNQSNESAESASEFFRRQVEQGLPLESIKLRILERYPDLEPTAFNEDDNDVAGVLDRYDQVRAEVDNGGVVDTAHNSDDDGDLDGLNIIAMLNYSSSAKYCRPRDPAINHDEFPFLTPSFASGNVFVSSALDRITYQAFFNPYITDVVRALVVGEALAGPDPCPNDRPTKHVGLSPPRRLFQVSVDPCYVGANFFSVFQDFLVMKMLVIGVLRYPSAILENLRPFVYTCPAPETTIHANDRLFVLG